MTSSVNQHFSPTSTRKALRKTLHTTLHTTLGLRISSALAISLFALGFAASTNTAHAQQYQGLTPQQSQAGYWQSQAEYCRVLYNYHNPAARQLQSPGAACQAAQNLQPSYANSGTYNGRAQQWMLVTTFAPVQIVTQSAQINTAGLTSSGATEIRRQRMARWEAQYASGAADGQSPAHMRRQLVIYRNTEKPGTIVIDSRNNYLYLTKDKDYAIRYYVDINLQNCKWQGTTNVKRKAVWPTWKRMIKQAKIWPNMPKTLPPGTDNPYGARALHLGQGCLAIHGTADAGSIGDTLPAGCFQLSNHDIADLFNRVDTGTTTKLI